ncbi:hypothetical protein [Vibrio rumoiensis]|uniref:hypothetical protein n=1 Tax=Vibrio rumoiensis TaxID=76258 RepID=UPI000D784B80|nr:hypothetical protein [Vibrio rumoiensis]
MKSILLNKLNCLVNSFSLMLCLLALSLISQASWADETCSVKGNKDFDITVSIDSYDPALSYDVYYEKNGSVVIWSNHDSSAVIYETSLQEGQNYQLKFFYDSASSMVTYYKNENDSAVWSQGIM